MKNPRISMIAAIGKNRELGAENKLLWKIPEDMNYFRDITMRHPVITGRKSYDSIPEKYRPLPGRVNIIVSRSGYEAPGAIVVDSIEKAIEKATELDKDEVFIIGGAQIYALGLQYADRLYLTFVDGEFPNADTFFPEYNAFTKEVSRRDSEGNGFKYSFVILEK